MGGVLKSVHSSSNNDVILRAKGGQIMTKKLRAHYMDGPLLYVVQHCATRGRSVLLSNFLKTNILAATKLVEGCFIGDLALVSFAKVAYGFRFDSNRRGWLSPV